MAPPPHRRFKAVMFDIGGVVLRSPFIAIAAYERELGIPPDYLNCSIVARGSQGAWQRFERGELSLYAFYDAFGKDLSDTRNGNVWYADYCRRRKLQCPELPRRLEVDGRELFGRMMREANAYDPHILLAIRKLRAAGRHRVIAVTNNFTKVFESLPDGEGNQMSAAELAHLGWDDAGISPKRLRSLFDDFCDSSVLGVRKPEPEIFLLACKRNNVTPEQAVFLDDIKMNLKAARELGMETIHVPLGGSLEAVKRLEEVLGMNLASVENDSAKL